MPVYGNRLEAISYTKNNIRFRLATKLGPR